MTALPSTTPATFAPAAPAGAAAPDTVFRFAELVTTDTSFTVPWSVDPSTDLYARTSFTVTGPAEMAFGSVPASVLWRVAMWCLVPHWVLLRPCRVILPFRLPPGEREFWQRLCDAAAWSLAARIDDPIEPRRVEFVETGAPLPADEVRGEFDQTVACFSGGRDSLTQLGMLLELGRDTTLMSVRSPRAGSVEHTSVRHGEVMGAVRDRTGVPLFLIDSDFRDCVNNGYAARYGIAVTELTDCLLYQGAGLLTAWALRANAVSMAAEYEVQVTERRGGIIAQHPHFMYSAVTLGALSALAEQRWGISVGSLSSSLRQFQVQRLLALRYPHLADLQYSCWELSADQAACSTCGECARIAWYLLSDGQSPQSASIDLRLLLRSQPSIAPTPGRDFAGPGRALRAQAFRDRQRQVSVIDRDQVAQLVADDPVALAAFDRLRSEALDGVELPIVEPGYNRAYLGFVDPALRPGLTTILSEHFEADDSPAAVAAAARSTTLLDWIRSPLTRPGDPVVAAAARPGAADSAGAAGPGTSDTVVSPGRSGPSGGATTSVPNAASATTGPLTSGASGWTGPTAVSGRPAPSGASDPAGSSATSGSLDPAGRSSAANRETTAKAGMPFRSADDAIHSTPQHRGARFVPPPPLTAAEWNRVAPVLPAPEPTLGRGPHGRRLRVSGTDLGGSERDYLAQCVADNYISSTGPFVDRFERAFADLTGTRHAIACSSGTTALQLAYAAAGVRCGDEVIVPTFTMVATANVVSHLGARPVFVDTDPATWNLSLDAVVDAITPATRAIVMVHTYGRPVDPTPFRDLAERHGVALIEDAAEAHGAAAHGRPVGGLGDAAAFSFYGNKILSTGEGGMVTTDDDSIAAVARELRDHGFSPERHFWHRLRAYNFRLSNLQAAVGLAQTERAEALIEARARLGARYDVALDGLAGLDLAPPLAPGLSGVMWMYAVRVRPDFPLSRDQVREELAAAGIETRTFFVPLHLQPAYLRDQRGSFPVAEQLSREGLYLPSDPTMTTADVEYVAGALRRLATTPIP